MKQTTFASLAYAGKKKRTRREKFLAEMEAVVPWARLTALIEPHYPKAGPKGGRPPMPLEVMLRVYCLQQWYALSDPAAEEALYDSDAMRRFAGLELGDDAIPDETTILNFRHLLERHELTRAIFEAVNAYLREQGILLREGTLVDATLIDAPSSTKNKQGARDPEMTSTKKGNEWYFGMKAHVGVDLDSGAGPLDGSQHRQGARQPEVRRPAARRRARGVRRQGLCQRRAGGGVPRPGQGLGRDAQGAEGRQAASHRRAHQPDHRQPAGQGRASVPGAEVPVRLSQDPLPRPGEERGAALSLFGLGNLFLVRRRLMA